MGHHRIHTSSSLTDIVKHSPPCELLSVYQKACSGDFKFYLVSDVKALRVDSYIYRLCSTDGIH